jgi:AraC-like DNA-binding protein
VNIQKSDHLALRLVRLKASDQWASPEGAIAFVFSKAGVGAYTSRTVTHRIGPGDILILSGATEGKLSADGKGDFLFRHFSFTLEHLFPLFESAAISLLNHVIENLKSVRIHAGNSALAMACQGHLEAVSPQFNLEHRGQLLRIAAAILSVEFENAQHQRGGFGRPGDHMLQAFEKLSSAELLSLSVGELATKFNCGRRHLNRLFHEHFGVSVAALRMEMRLLKAVSLLRDAEIKVINVAEQCGFNHLGLFNTCFKRRFGTSPGAWRKSQLQGEAPVPGIIAGAQSCPLQNKGICPWTGWTSASPHAKGAAVAASASRTEAPAKNFPSAGARKNASEKIPA